VQAGWQQAQPFPCPAATLLTTVAKHHVGLEGRHLDLLRGFARNLQPESRGFTEKNRAFLRQFADPHALVALLRLADDLVRRAERGGAQGRRVAVLVEMAVAIAIELVIPLRVDNLAGLRIDRHLHRHGSIVLLSIPAAETKNGSAIDAELPPRLVRLLE